MRGAVVLPFAALIAVAIPAAAQDEAALDVAQDMTWHSQQQLKLLELFNSGEWNWIEGGLLWRRVKGDGQGPKPTVEDIVTVHYAGTLTNGTQFDSSYERGEPASFPLGRLIPAWQLAIPQMAVGDTIELAAPADLAYGPEGRGPIPPNATLLFAVELLGIGEPEEAETPKE